MKFLKHTFVTVIVGLVGMTLLTKVSFASEGTVELRSRTEQNYKCYVSSIQMMDLNYEVLVTCRNLLYPAGEDIFNYILWANPVGGGKQINLGSLGLGRAKFSTKTAFDLLYVTTESSKKAKTPEGPVVMRGDLKPIEFLSVTETPTEKKTDTTEAKKDDEATPTPTSSTTSRVITGLKRAGVILVLLLFTVVGLIFVVTRKK